MNAASLWIKICGNTTLEDAMLGAEAGADAVGFVFAVSPRRVALSRVAGITPHLPQQIEKIGVFVDASFNDILLAVREGGLSGVQLHSDAGPDMPSRLRDQLGPRLRILRVVHFGPDAAEQAARIATDPNLDAVLVDSRTATAVGGTGITFDWNLARTSLFQNAGAPKRLVAAGGLTPDNVAEAIGTLHPWGVDVSSGVERTPGRKDPARVRAFVASARAAARAWSPAT